LDSGFEILDAGLDAGRVVRPDAGGHVDAGSINMFDAGLDDDAGQDSGPETPDASQGTDGGATVDAGTGVDAGPDAGAVGADAGGVAADAGEAVDAGADAGEGAGPDAGADAGVDGGADGGSDAGDGGGNSPCTSGSQKTSCTLVDPSSVENSTCNSEGVWVQDLPTLCESNGEECQPQGPEQASCVLPNPVLHMAFNGNAISSVNNFEGTVTGGVSFVGSMNYTLGAAASFGVTGGSIEFPNSAYDDRLNPTDAITMAAWVYRSSDSPYEGTILQKVVVPGDSYGYLLKLFNPTNPVVAGLSRSGATYGNWSVGSCYDLNSSAVTTQVIPFCNTIATFSSGSWHHIATTYGKLDGAFRLYFDGINITTTTITNPILRGIRYHTTNANLSIGSNQNLTVDDVRIYDVALTQEQIRVLYNPDPDTGVGLGTEDPRPKRQ
jgi:hypothetical protein